MRGIDGKNDPGAPQKNPAASASGAWDFLSIREELRRIVGDDPTIDWQESRQLCVSLLLRVQSQCAKSGQIAALLDGTEFRRAGDEHDIAVDPRSSHRLLKLTFGDNLGCRLYFSPHDPEGSGKHFHPTGNADPFYYLDRWLFLNEMCSDFFKVDFEGIVSSERDGFLPRICVSQPVLPEENPPIGNLHDAFEKNGFCHVSQDTYYQPSSGLILGDAHPRNVRIVEGIPVPFDAIIQFADFQMRSWLDARL